MKTKKLVVLVIAAMGIVAAPAFAAVGDTATWKFDLPSTTVASQSPPYPLVATLTLTEVAGGVNFLLTPNWSSTGFSSNSRVNSLDYVYQGPPAASFAFISGAPINTFSYKINPNNMGSGYQTDDQHIEIKWFTSNTSNRFDNDWSSSRWSVSGAGVDLTDFTGTQAISGTKPSPIFGVISVSQYSLQNQNPTPSSWVSAVPEPETYAMFMAGLGLMGFMARRRKQKETA